MPSNTPPPGWPIGEPYQPYIPSGPSTPGTDYDKNPTKNWYPNGQYGWDDPYLNGDAQTRNERYPHYWSYGDPDPNWRPSFYGETPPWNRNPNDTTGSANTQKGDWFGNTMRDKPKETPAEKERRLADYRDSDAVEAGRRQADRDSDAAFWAAGGKRGHLSNGRTFAVYPPGWTGPRKYDEFNFDPEKDFKSGPLRFKWDDAPAGQAPKTNYSSGYPAQQGVSDMQTAPWNSNDSYSYGGGQYGYGGPSGGGQYGGGGAPRASRIGYELMGLPNPYQEQMKQQMQGMGGGQYGEPPMPSYGAGMSGGKPYQGPFHQGYGGPSGGGQYGGGPQTQERLTGPQGYGGGGQFGGGNLGGMRGDVYWGGAPNPYQEQMKQQMQGMGGGNARGQDFARIAQGFGQGGGAPMDFAQGFGGADMLRNMMMNRGAMGGGGGNPFQSMMGGMGGGGGNPFQSMMGGMGGGGGNPFQNMMGGMGGGGGNPFQNMMGGMGGMGGGGGNPFMNMMGGGSGNPFMNMMRRY